MKLKDIIEIKHDCEGFPYGVIVTATLRVKTSMIVSNLEVENAEDVDFLKHIEEDVKHRLIMGLYGWVAEEISNSFGTPDVYDRLSALILKLINCDVEVNIQ